MDDFCYDISLRVSKYLYSDDATRWITPITGYIEHFGEGGCGEEVGKVSFYHVDLSSASEHGLNPWYVLDNFSETAPFMALFKEFDDHLQIDSSIAEDQRFSGLTANMLVGNRLEILPGHRGKGLTKVVFNEFVRLFGAVRVVRYL